MKNLLIFTLVILFQSCVSAELKIVKDIPYKTKAEEAYEKERCKLDVYLTAKSEKVPVFVWFHGGGIQANSKDKEDEVVVIAKKFARNGVAFVAVNYRLHPKVKYPAYIEDVAASVKWTIDNAEKYNFDSSKIFIGGHSAGGYLTMMTSFKNEFTDKVGLDVSKVAGSIPVSGQTVTHSTVRKEMGISRNTIIVDEKAHLYHFKKMKLPTFLIAGDKDLEMRAEESQILYSGIKSVSKQTRFKIYDNRNHVSVVTLMKNENDPVFNDIMNFINQVSLKK